MPGCALGQSFDTVDPVYASIWKSCGGAGMPQMTYRPIDRIAPACPG